MITLECIQCGDAFKVKNYRVGEGAKFCSVACKGDWMSKNVRGTSHPNWVPKVVVFCKNCGNKIESALTDLEKGHGIFCCKRCWYDWSSKNRKGSIHPHFKQVSKKCSYCEKEFFVSRKFDERQFCSRICKNLFNKSKKKRICVTCGKEFIQTMHEGVQKNCSRECQRISFTKQIQRTCQFCGEKFTVNPYQVKQDWGQFCSRSCHGKWKSENIVGERSPSWRGGLSFEPYCPKFNKDFKERVRVFFGRKCVECGTTEEENGRKLDVHHVNYDKKTCCNDKPPLFVATCRHHNIKANHDREYWEKHYTEIIMTKYHGKCYFTKTEMKARCS
jgi:hypothetical protein